MPFLNTFIIIFIIIIIIIIIKSFFIGQWLAKFIIDPPILSRCFIDRQGYWPINYETI